MLNKAMVEKHTTYLQRKRRSLEMLCMFPTSKDLGKNFVFYVLFENSVSAP